jgi:hypothetical protein
MELRELMGQGMAIALLGGFRAITADWLWVKLHTEWEQYQWERMPPLLRAVTWLQPQCELFWDMGGWHLAYNLYAAQLEDIKIPDPETRRAKARGWLEAGERFLKDGITSLPNDAELYVSLARLYDDSFRFDDPCRGADWWKQALDKKGCPPYAHRMVGHSLQRCAELSGDRKKLREAFDWWRELWLRPHDDPTELWGIIRRELIVLKELVKELDHLSPEEETALAQQEAQFGIPPAQRIFGRDEKTLSPSELQERFRLWTVEWLRPHRGDPQLWSGVRRKLVEIKARIPLSEEEERRWAEEEARLDIPTSERVFQLAQAN